MASNPITYQHLVSCQKYRNPCVNNLSDFLENSNGNSICRVKALDFVRGKTKLKSRDVNDIHTELTTSRNRQFMGQILIIEDLTSSVIEALGSNLNIDPLFFASHLDTPSMTTDSLAPDKATLPSRLRSKDYINIHYHRTIKFEDEMPKKHLSLRRSNTCIHRKVTALMPIKDIRLGLAQHCVSIYRTMRSAGDWLAIILTDPSIGHLYKDTRDNDFTYRSTLFAAGYEDFLDPPFNAAQRTNTPLRDNLMDDLIYYWGLEEYGSATENPTLISLSRYPLQIVAREWVNYVSIMSHSVKQYEHDSKDFSEYMNTAMDLKELQRWRRRTMASEQKIGAVLRFLRHARTAEKKEERGQWSTYIEDWQYISQNLKGCGRLLENMVPVAQIIDARRSVEETRNTGKLTTLALIFLPLSLFASIFSMTEEFSPGNSRFWVYFTVAIPICILLYLVMRPPVWVNNRLEGWRRKRRVPDPV